MKDRTPTGTLELPTVSAVALWKSEICGQLSDGAWENTMPLDHWHFWCRLDVKHVPSTARVVTEVPWKCKKTGYNLATLYQYVGDRMLATGRMARALEACGVTEPTREQIEVGEYLEGIDSMVNLTKALDPANGVSEYRRSKLAEVDQAHAQAFFTSSYTMKDMRKDIASIKAAMKTVPR